VSGFPAEPLGSGLIGELELLERKRDIDLVKLWRLFTQKYDQSVIVHEYGDPPCD
jgi:hypothetical protein